MSTSHIIKIPRYESTDSPVLVHVLANDQSELNFDLLATDGDSAFKGKIRKRNLKKLRSPSYEGSDEEWAALMSFVFTLKPENAIHRLEELGLDVACTISDEDSKSILSISFRIQIEDITQRLGSVELKQTSDTEGVDLFGWAVSLVGQRDAINNQFTDRTAKLEVADKSIASLQLQLDELIKAKSDHETELLSKFTVLLNEKKLQIRNLQRILETGKADKQKVEALAQTSRTDRESPVSSRAQKRRAENDTVEIESDESDGFEKMDVESNANVRRDGDSIRSTSRSRTSTTDTESEAEDEIDQKRFANHGSRKQSTPTKKSSKLPPPRLLPFQKKKENDRQSGVQKAPKTANQAVIPDDESTASEDDEL